MITLFILFVTLLTFKNYELWSVNLSKEYLCCIEYDANVNLEVEDYFS